MLTGEELLACLLHKLKLEEIRMIKKILEVTYKCAVLALLGAAVFLLWDIRAHQQTFPTVGDVRKAGFGNPGMIRRAPELERVPSAKWRRS